MACEVCQHCDTSVEPGKGAIHNGLSYHTHCHRCFVCGETDLRNAETFRGVIFCFGCSQRIFQGCSTARQAKFMKEKRRSPHRRRRRNDRVLTVTLTNSDRSSREFQRNNRVYSEHSHVINKTTKEIYLKKDSTERGTTTDVTQETLKRARNQGIPRIILPTPVKPRKKRKIHKQKHHKNDCSDLRIAELGASVEIAHMTLRKPSELPVIIKSEMQIKPLKLRSTSELNQISDKSEDSSKWREPTYSIDEDSVRTPWMQRRIASIVKIPLKSFKRNILDRSSRISIFGYSKSYNKSAVKKFKTMFNEDIMEHHRNGVKKLYSAINRKNVPCKLGCSTNFPALTITHTLVVATKCDCGVDGGVSDSGFDSRSDRPKTNEKPNKRCKHFENSHSYRCMRKQVMRLAGPTSSELAVIREKMFSALSPNLLKNILEYNQKYVALLSTQAFRRK